MEDNQEFGRDNNQLYAKIQRHQSQESRLSQELQHDYTKNRLSSTILYIICINLRGNNVTTSI